MSKILPTNSSVDFAMDGECEKLRNWYAPDIIIGLHFW